LPSRIATAIVTIGILAFGSVGAYAAAGHVNAARSTQQKAVKKAERRHHKARHHAAAARSLAPSAVVRTTAQPTAPVAAETGGRSAAAQEYGTRPGKGCGDKNHDHTGPPGNPGNTGCPHHP
jgi:hypothetical protein